jgi:hypothetical protein
MLSTKRDKISDVIAVLNVMREQFGRTRNYRKTTELRKDAVNEIAEAELRSGRFKDQDSASKSIHDACSRRLGSHIRDFDRLADEWLRQNSKELKNVLLSNSDGSSQRNMVIDFFSKRGQVSV